jgi:hypothetical protein
MDRQYLSLGLKNSGSDPLQANIDKFHLTTDNSQHTGYKEVIT